MRGYELTERGKRLVVMLVVVLLLIPSVIIIVNAFSKPDSDTPSDISPAVSPPSVTGGGSPSPAVSGAVQSESPEPSDTPDQSESPEPSDTPDQSGSPEPSDTQGSSGTSHFEPVLEGGTLTFSFSPDSQTELDDKTAALLGDFLKIPDYLPNYLIIVETLTLPPSDADTLMRAVTDAFAHHGVKKSQIEHVSRTESEQSGTAEVKLLFVSILEK